MSKASSRRVKSVGQVAPYDKRKIDFTKFQPDMLLKDLTPVLKPVSRNFPISVAIQIGQIETLSPAKTIGAGRTNLTIKVPTLVQVDTGTPYVSFDLSTTSGDPTISMHFEPQAYGITTVSTFMMNFLIDAAAPCTFLLSGGPGASFLSGDGTKVLNGRRSVTLLFKNVPPSQQVYGYLQQTAGGAWQWYTARVSYLPLLIKA
jgi:hypothetical protein